MWNEYNYKTKRGFTLVEIIIVLAIMGIIISFGMIIDLNVFKTNILQAEQSTIVATLEKARSRSMSNMFTSAHGVCYIAPNYVIFRGRTTCEPTTETDEIIPANTTVATASNFSTTFPIIIFDQLSGNTTGATIHITDGIKSADIMINNEGAINW
ncbi:hypothetical protein A3B85_00780 [Candidatus Nomurabacteria bacterium RIFCSPHIGHO2_02_FULL_37_13]|uniref:General secretion pathway GspH domain-containing protein n=1 Tax=Candidatus Nomurabacteria bacterium RIFCSPHIGHO2_02_FULL_37_13 TaxID=1801750 RepID=A0A1F6W5Q3_9BACT|nr:MAG: hypothetical protein A2640_03150 [Candidatus Nomurabacteria bacterium RIFCSPHIGHO2_01_FULL_36_23]OGI77015.1 MAG: hypothetical protein A3B85_00780 [Candidatus Nomurabacteria bacterium RIFCSPHIGHO2_02_FULL_37_13]OGI88613.1 MAG: hypothetical protein A2906_03250 [Candidatus Nomurabacteria bacterium RIFCSPLOWO2_01_FULL_37_25]